MIFLLSLSGCEQDDGQFSVSPKQNDFFKDKNSNLFLAKKLFDLNQKHNFLSTISDRYGIPNWENAITSSSTIMGKGSVNNDDFIFIPLMDEKYNFLSSVLIVENANSDETLIYTISRDELKYYLDNSQDSVEKKEKLLALFLHFDNLIYGDDGKREYRNIPEELFVLVPTSEFNTKKIKISSTITSTSMGKVVMMYSWHCTGCKGICDLCDICVTPITSFSLGSGIAWSNGSGSGGNNSGVGDSPPDGGGGGSNSNYDPSIPWYLAHPDIDPFTYSSATRNLYRSLVVNFHLGLQPEHMEFLELCPGLSRNLLNFLNSNHVIATAELVVWGINHLYEKNDCANSAVIANLEFLQIDEIITNGIEDVPCLMEIYNNLGGSKTLQGILNNFRDEVQLQNQQNAFNPRIANLSFYNDNNFYQTFDYIIGEDNVLANVSYESLTLNNINIIINFNTDLTTNSSIYDYPKVVTTYAFIHEIFHAEMFRYLWLKRTDHWAIYSESELFDMLGEHRNDLIFNTFTAAYMDNHHNVMAQLYRNVIVDALQEIYPSMTNNQATALAWIGMENTIAYQNEIQNSPGFLNNQSQILQDVLQNFSDNCL
ncbi:MAG: hypothetical protein Q4G27_05345 [Flavobacteriaceae bacterium]|nr:hypothetical protein [Flavobacteriaceae bacterium]